MAIGTDEVKVLGSYASPFAARPRIALNLKGVNYEFQHEILGAKSELLLQSNPVNKKIPVLIHNGKPISESMIIVEYIDDVWSSCGSAILPTDAHDRAIARFWAHYTDDKVFSNILGIIRGQTEDARVEFAEQLSKALVPLEEAFEKCSKGKDFFGGDTIGYLDIALGAYSSWILASEKITGVGIFDEDKLPLLVGWMERFRSVEAVKDLMPVVDELVEKAKMIREKFGGAPPSY